jgi:hypothetical protein
LTAITFADIQRVKSYANQLKMSRPELTHGQRLDVAAAALLAVRNFHEARRRRESAIMASVMPSTRSDDMSHCLFCDFTFITKLKSDVDAHRSRHEAVEEATEALDYHPQGYPGREIMKQDGRDRARYGVTLDDQKQGLLQAIRGWYDRSLYSAMEGGYWRKHPSFERYIPMVISSCVDQYSLPAQALIAEYGQITNEIEPGGTYWIPKADLKGRARPRV